MNVERTPNPSPFTGEVAERSEAGEGSQNPVRRRPSRPMNLSRHGRACPGHPRLNERAVCKDVDARHKAGHDAEVSQGATQ
jgi:hypothetical protein